MHYLSRLFFVTFILTTFTTAYSATIQPGDLLISEVMANPSAVSDTNGEWFELFNASSSTINLNGMTLSDDNSNSHQIDNGASLLIPAGGYLVLARNDNQNENGGFLADYVYSDFTLGNSSDQIILSLDSIEITRLDYSGSPFGIAGISAELINQTANPQSSDYQLTQNSTYGLGDIGTPGGVGSVALESASPVPLPSALWLFISAFIFLFKSSSASFCSQQSMLSNY